MPNLGHRRIGTNHWAKLCTAPSHSLPLTLFVNSEFNYFVSSLGSFVRLWNNVFICLLSLLYISNQLYFILLFMLLFARQPDMENILLLPSILNVRREPTPTQLNWLSLPYCKKEREKEHVKCDLILCTVRSVWGGEMFITNCSSGWFALPCSIDRDFTKCIGESVFVAIFVGCRWISRLTETL